MAIFAGVVFAHLLLKLFEVAGSVRRQSVAAIHERVHEDAVNPVLFGHAEQGVEMSLVRVHAAVGEQSEEVKTAAASASVFHGCNEDWVGEELAVLDHQLDARAVHVNDASRADVKVAHLAVAHLTVGKSNVGAAGLNQGVGILSQKAVVRGLAGERDGIGLGLGAIAPAIEDN